MCQWTECSHVLWQADWNELNAKIEARKKQRKKRQDKVGKHKEDEVEGDDGWADEDVEVKDVEGSVGEEVPNGVVKVVEENGSSMPDVGADVDVIT